jgi:hypothetical protein
MYEISGDLLELLQGGIASVVGTADGDNRPHVSAGWGTSAAGDGRTLSTYIEVARCQQALADVAETGRMAITVASPISYRSVQFKGRCVATRLATPEEEAQVTAGADLFLSTVALIGDPPQATRNLKMSGPMRRFEIEVEAAFDQTPGPGAGKPL